MRSAATLAVLLVTVAVVFGDPIVITADTTINAGNAGTYENQDVIVRGCTVTINVPLNLNSLVVERNAGNIAGVVTHGQGLAGGLQLAVQTHVVVQGADGQLVASRIDASEKGFAGGTGPGAGAGAAYVAGGGGHAGRGAAASSGAAGGPAYDEVKLPTGHGSGGGNTSWAGGGAGGGCVVLSVSGTLTLDGLLAANGANGERAYDSQASGAGAGGTVRLAVAQLAGSGTISASGGYGRGCWNGTSGGGGGGRIAVQAGSATFTGTIVAAGDVGGMPAGAGTVFTQFGGDTDGRLAIANIGTAGEVTPSLAADVFDEVVVGSGGRLLLAGATALGAAQLRAAPGGRVEIATEVQFGAVVVEPGGVLAPPAGSAGFHLQTTGDVEVQAGGTIDAAGRGYAAASGPGAGEDDAYYAGGAGHGGPGGASGNGAMGGPPYDSPLLPVEPGSGGGTMSWGPGGAGGGVLRITAGGALLVNGSITADGAGGVQAYGFSGSGGGAGGSLCLSASQLRGAGTIHANGGAGPLQAGGGAGGRIAVYTCDQQMDPAQITALGGGGFQAGADGTVLHVSPYITITQQPVGGVFFAGEPIVLAIDAGSTHGTLHHRWRRDGADLFDDPPRVTGTQTATLQITAAVVGDQGDYDVWLTDDCGNYLSDTVRVIVPPPGDTNCDGTTDFSDINPFVLILSNPAAYLQAYPDCRLLQGDCDDDGAVDFRDINPFVVILSQAQ